MSCSKPVLIGLVLALFVTSCRRSENAASEKQSSKEAKRQTFQVKGVVEGLKANGRTAIIKHEEIPNYMPAMTMPLDVKDTNELKGLKVGDSISFRMIVTDDDGWIDQVRKIETNIAAANPPETFRRAPLVEPLNVGDPLPNYWFTNQAGRAVSTEQFRGQALAFTFIFTKCLFPTFCPRMSQNFTEVQRLLLTRAAGPTNWHLLAISFDPANDTPQVMQEYAKRYSYNPAHWSFVTGDMMTTDGITEQFGLQFWRQDGTINHNLRTVVIDARGRVQQVFNGNEWKAAAVVDEIVKAALVK